jgi:hypothetical protein
MSEHMYGAMCVSLKMRQAVVSPPLANSAIPQGCVTRVQGDVTMPLMSYRFEELHLKPPLIKLALEQQILTPTSGFSCIRVLLVILPCNNSFHCCNLTQCFKSKCAFTL